MNNIEIHRQHQRIIALYNKAGPLFASDIEAQSHWAKYICILSSGLLENAIKELYKDFVQRSASRPVVDHVVLNLDKIQNPKSSRFVEIARSFKTKWADDLEVFVGQNGRKEAIDSIMANRHLIAHGKDSGITLARIKQYLDRSVEVIEYIENQCKN